MKWKAFEQARNLMKELGKIIETGMDELIREAQRNEYGKMENILWEAIELRDELNDTLIEILLRYQPLARELRFIRSTLDSSYDLYRIARHLWRIEAMLIINAPESARETVVGGLTLIKPWLMAGVNCITENCPLNVPELPFFEESFEEFWNRNVRTDNPYTMAVLIHCDGIFNHTKNILRSALYYLEGSKGIERAPILFVS